MRSRWAPAAHALLTGLVAAAAARPAAALQATAHDTVREVQYLAAAPTGEVDAFGLLVGRATTDPHDHSGVSVLLAQGNAEGSLGDWSARGSLRLLLTDVLAPSQDTRLFFQELFAAWRKDELVQVKLGKFYQHFGREWDYGFSGPLLFGNDLKMRPDVGVGLEGSPQLTDTVDLRYALQYFVADGQSFGSLTGDAWGGDIRHRNTLVFNVAPGLQFAPGVEARVGASGKVGQTFLTAEGQGASGIVTTFALDLDTRFKNAGAYLEVGRQFEDSTNLTSNDINFDTELRVPAFTYVWAGAKYDLGSLSVRLAYNDQFFADRDRETQLLPGLTYEFNKNIQLMAEFNLWLTNNLRARANTHDSRFRDRALYIGLSANI